MWLWGPHLRVVVNVFPVAVCTGFGGFLVISKRVAKEPFLFFSFSGK